VFWDGRTIGATTQALLPLVNPIEMGVQTEQQILRRLQLIPGYVALFANAFPPSSYDRVTGSPITGANLGLAVSSFESTVVSFNAPIDRYLAGEEDALERRCAGRLSHLRSGPVLALPSRAAVIRVRRVFLPCCFGVAQRQLSGW
jgi:cytochrome c peroxidase